ncbi:MAG: metallophosphoesterase [Planctomycetes bacterium]|nr:metallophosphoesterase [Planctomycetota bacterium]
MTPWTWLLLLAVANTMLGHAVLLRRGRPVGAAIDSDERPVRVSHVAQAALAVALATVLEGLLLGPLVLGPWGVVHLMWLDLAIVVPVCGLELLVAASRGRHASRPARTLAVLSLLLVPVVVYARDVEPHHVRVERVDVPLDARRAGHDAVRIAVLADLQTRDPGAFEDAVIDQLLAQHADLVLLPGDLFSGTPGEFEQMLPRLRALLARLDAPGGVFLVAGDGDDLPDFERVVEGTQVRLLHDETVRLSLGDRRITLLGLHHLKEAEDAGAVIDAFERQAGDDDVRLLLVHRPRAVLALPESCRTDLVIAGHTHGGQVAFPWFGPPYTGSPLPREVAAGGLHELEGRRLYVSRGIGLKGPPAPPIRFLVPPEISLLTLR